MLFLLLLRVSFLPPPRYVLIKRAQVSAHRLNLLRDRLFEAALRAVIMRNDRQLVEVVVFV